MTFTMSFSDFLMTSMTFVIWNQSNLLYMLVARPMQRSPLSEWGQIHFEVASVKAIETGMILLIIDIWKISWQVPTGNSRQAAF